MHLKYEHLAATSMLGTKGSPPRDNGKLQFDREWEQQAFGIALALAKKGHFEWEDFRQGLISSIGEWEGTHDLADSSWDYYERWLLALERLAIETGIIEPQELADRIGQISATGICKYATQTEKQRETL